MFVYRFENINGQGIYWSRMNRNYSIKNRNFLDKMAHDHNDEEHPNLHQDFNPEEWSYLFPDEVDGTYRGRSTSTLKYSRSRC